MRAILSRCFVIEENFFCIVGLRIEDGHLEPRIGLTSNGETVAFTKEEWDMFCQLKTEIDKYFQIGHGFSVENFSNKEILFRNTWPRNILIKSKTTWNSVRINAVVFRKLMEIKDCINRKMRKIQKKTGYANYQLKEIVQQVADRIHYNCNVSQVLFQKCIDLELMVPKPPPLIDKDFIEILKTLEKNKDAVAFELTQIFEDHLIQIIREKIIKELASCDVINTIARFENPSDEFQKSDETGQDVPY